VITVSAAVPGDALIMAGLLDEMDRFTELMALSRSATGCGRSTKQSSPARSSPGRCSPATAPPSQVTRRTPSCGRRSV